MSTEVSPTTAFQLSRIVQETKPKSNPLPGYEGKSISRFTLGVCMDECYPGLYIGDLGAAKNKNYLVKVGITHVLNTAEGNKFATVDTNQAYYTEVGIKYLGLELLDIPSANISRYFEVGANFIDEALSSGGRVLVHCFMGISRSSTIACAYLMLKKGMTAAEALQTLRRNRAIFPNNGFLSQLAELDNRLHGNKRNL